MDRKKFIKASLLGSLGVALLPQLSFAFTTEVSYEELIGKGAPKLFGTGYQLRKETNEAFIKMAAEALKSDIKIQVVSSYRSFEHQNRIWERKYKRYQNQGLSPEAGIAKIIEYSTIPGTSRHHWGTDLDIIDANVRQPSSVLQPQHFEENGCYRKLKLWMENHANSFGFFLVYTKEPSRKGFKYEPWHYSYKALSQGYLQTYKTFDLKTIISKEQLMGHANFSDAFINRYLKENILDINPVLL